jgi:hypothetical protein
MVPKRTGEAPDRFPWTDIDVCAICTSLYWLAVVGST